jgi:hypothetical protein
MSTPIIDAARACVGKLDVGPIGALRIACPKEPLAEWLTGMVNRLHDNCCADDCSFRNMAERLHLNEWHAIALAAYRAQPLWIELWGDDGSGR